MTAETLKPFITPQNVESCPTAQPGVTTKRRHRNTYFLAIGLSTISLILLTAVIGYTIWLSMRVNNTETENARLNRVIENMQKRLGLHYLDEIENFEKEYANTFTDDPTSLDDLEGNYDDNDRDDDDDEDDDDNDDNHNANTNDDNDDDEEDEDDKDTKKDTKLDVNKDNDSDEDIDDDESEELENLETYDEIREYLRKNNAMNKYKDNYDDYDNEDGSDVDDATAINHEDSSNTSEDDNLYGDFENYKDSKKKKENSRITRSITQLPNELTQSKNETENHQNHNNTVQSELRPHLRSEPSGSDINTSNFVSDKVKSHRFTPLRPRSQRQRKFPIIKSGESLISAKNVNNARQSPSTGLNSIRPAAHFHLNRKVPERHGAIRVDSYPGDMYIGHHPSWSNEVGTQHYFTVQNGVLTVREPGLYYVYAQICYNNTHDQNGFVIFHGHTPFLQCLNTVPTNLPLKIHTCHTSGLIYLRESDTIHLRDFHSDRNVILKDSNNRSYFGLIKV